MKKGDKVTLKSGSSLMTVTSGPNKNDQVYVMWFNFFDSSYLQGELKGEWIACDALEVKP